MDSNPCTGMTAAKGFCGSLAGDVFFPLIGERPWMSRTLTLLFRRDPSRDRHTELTKFEGYEILWPDGQPWRLLPTELPG